jgi:aminopeptidase N
MITSVADGHARMAVDFVLSHLAQVNQLIDISGRSRFMQRLVAASNDASLIPTLESYANANLGASDRKPIERAIDQLRFQSSILPRVRTEVAAWLKSHPA